MNKQKIVLIEDDRILSSSLYRGLTEAGFEVLRAYNGEEGFPLVVKEKPDLVLLDILMPKINGLVVAKMLQGNPETKDIPIIVLTVLDQVEPLAEALETGIFEYLVKADYKVDEIVEKVKARLKHSVQK